MVTEETGKFIPVLPYLTAVSFTIPYGCKFYKSHSCKFYHISQLEVHLHNSNCYSNGCHGFIKVSSSVLRLPFTLRSSQNVVVLGVKVM